MREDDFYKLCRDTANSHITSCGEYKREGCPMVCWYARERNAEEKKSGLEKGVVSEISG